MVHESEVIMLMLGVAVLVFLADQHHLLRRTTGYPFLFWIVLTLVVACSLTVLEGLVCGVICNFFEHLCYMLSCLLLFAWTWKTFAPGRDSN